MTILDFSSVFPYSIVNKSSNMANAVIPSNNFVTILQLFINNNILISQFGILKESSHNDLHSK